MDSLRRTQPTVTLQNRTGLLKTVMLLVILLFCSSEIKMMGAMQVKPVGLDSPISIVAIFLSLLAFSIGLLFLVTGFWRPNVLQQYSARVQALGWVRFAAAGAILILHTFLFLFSPLQGLLTTPWLGLLFAAVLVQLILFVVAPHRTQTFGMGELALTILLFLYPRLVQEARLLLSVAMQYRLVMIAGFTVLLLVTLAAYSRYSDRIAGRLLTWRQQLGSLRTIPILLFCVLPILYRYAVSRDVYLSNEDIRFAIFMIALWGAAYLISNGTGQLITWEGLGLAAGALTLVSSMALSSLWVTNYPFSLSWSEGNRLYEYSLVFGQSIYKHEGPISTPYAGVGRYGLWGILFIWQGLPIWVHRLWNLLLNTVPVLLFAGLLTRKLTPSWLRYGTLLWIALFLIIPAPLLPPIVIVMLIMALSAFIPSPYVRLALTILAGYYASNSRFTWAFAPGVVGMLIDLILYYPSRQGTGWRRVLPAFLIFVLGSLPGVLQHYDIFLSTTQGFLSRFPSAGNDLEAAPAEGPITSQQALLWERLLPSSTLPMGVLIYVLINTLPMIILLIWMMRSGRWRLNLLQKLVIWGSLAGFFLFGLLVSTKIGGGGDLHNMDMFLLLLFFLFVLGLMSSTTDSAPSSWPAWTLLLMLYPVALMFYSFTPFNPAARNLQTPRLASQQDVRETLAILREKATEYAANGEVLFIDQRQLLTFQYISGIDFVYEYEKKFMMDQSMANNQTYFHSYYEDLANRRFSLIVTEPLYTNLEEGTNVSFPNENDAWVRWVSIPTLCYYEPLYTSKSPRVQLLVPREAPVGCETYLE